MNKGQDEAESKIWQEKKQKEGIVQIYYYVGRDGFGRHCCICGNHFYP